MVLLGLFVGLTFNGASPTRMPLKAYTMAVVVAGIHALAAVADVAADRAAEQTTIATLLGERLAATFSVIAL